MALGVTFSDDLLKLIFNATPIANLADNAASSPITTLYVALHTADPSAGNQNTNEVVYTGYARVAVSRNSAGWTVTGNTCNPANNVTFPMATGGNNTAAFVSIGKNNTGVAGEIYFSGAMNNNLTIVNGIQPNFAAANMAAGLS